MASFGLLLALSGFEYDMVQGHIGFSPKWQEDAFSSFWSLNDGWGEFRRSAGQLELEVKMGTLSLSSFGSELLQGRDVQSVLLGGEEVAVVRSEGKVLFKEKITLDPAMSLIVKF